MTFSSRIVLAHDSLTQLGGAERVLAAMHEMYPSAPLFTLVKDSRLADKFRGWHITTSRLQFFYGLIPRLQYWLLLIPWAVGSLRLPEAKVVLSSSSFAIKGLRTPSGAVHINYCHTPTRFLWTDREYVDQEVPALLRPAVKSFLNWLKGWDLRAAARVDYFIANSLEVQQRIQRFYGRESV